jgi:hypothetical protein
MEFEEYGFRLINSYSQAIISPLGLSTEICLKLLTPA